MLNYFCSFEKKKGTLESNLLLSQSGTSDLFVRFTHLHVGVLIKLPAALSDLTALPSLIMNEQSSRVHNSKVLTGCRFAYALHSYLTLLALDILYI